MRARLVLLALLAGCAGPNLYVSARPLGAGRVQHALAVEGVGAVTPGGAAMLPAAPTYQLRIGLSERVDLLARVSNLSALGVDGLFSLHRGSIDVALVPGVRGSWLPFSAGTPAAVTTHLPLLVAVHLSSRVTVVGTAGAGFTASLGRSASAGRTSEVLDEAAGASSRGVFLRSGLGARFWLGPRFALHPEITLQFTPSTGRVTLIPGLGFVFGERDSV